MSQPPESFGDNSHPELWQHLEADFAGAEERAQAIVANEAEQQFLDLKAFVLGKLPPDVQLAPLQRSSYAHGGVLADDGYPLILYPEDAHAVAKEQPDIAAIMAHTANDSTLAERQQLELEMARAGGDESTMQPLLVRKAELDHKRDRIEFWSAVAALHPVDTSAVEAYQTNMKYSFHNFDTRVYSLVHIEEELQRMTAYNRENSPAYFKAYEQAYGHEDGQQAVIKRMKEIVEDTAVDIQKYRTLLDMVCFGRATLTETEEPTEEEIDVPELTDPALKLLDSLPGMDPVLMTNNNRLKELPQNGWMIVGKVKTAQQKGKIDIYRFTEGAIEVSDVHYSKKYGEGRLHVTLRPEAYGHVEIDCTNETDDNDYSDYKKDSIYRDRVAVGDGKELQYSFKPVRANSAPLIHTSIDSYDVATKAHRVTPAYKEYLEIQVVRMSESPEEARRIVAQIAEAMGLDEQGVTTALTILAGKDAFTDLKSSSPEESRALAKALEDRRPKVEDEDYPDDYYEY